MAVDESFKKEGAIPFKWEIRPGVPKVQASQPEQPPLQHHGFDGKTLHKEQLKEKSDPNVAFPGPPAKLAPPPAARLIQFHQPRMEPRARSVLSAPRALSERYGFFTSTLARSANVYPFGCLPSSPLLGKNDFKKKLKVRPESEGERCSDLESLSRVSLSSRKKPSSPFYASSPSFSSFSSQRSSPRTTNEADWAGFGLF